MTDRAKVVFQVWETNRIFKFLSYFMLEGYGLIPVWYDFAHRKVCKIFDFPAFWNNETIPAEGSCAPCHAFQESAAVCIATFA